MKNICWFKDQNRDDGHIQNDQGNIKEQERHLSLVLLFRGMFFQVERVADPDSFLRTEFETRKKSNLPRTLPTIHVSSRSDFSSCS